MYVHAIWLQTPRREREEDNGLDLDPPGFIVASESAGGLQGMCFGLCLQLLNLHLSCSQVGRGCWVRICRHGGSSRPASGNTDRGTAFPKLTLNTATEKLVSVYSVYWTFSVLCAPSILPLWQLQLYSLSPSITLVLILSVPLLCFLTSHTWIILSFCFSSRLI